MAGAVREARLGSPAARAKLKRGRQAHWVTLDRRSHLGWQRGDGKRAGRWLLRTRRDGRYTVAFVAPADDDDKADGTSVLSFHQARARAAELADLPERSAVGLTVAQAASEYLDYLRSRGKDARDAKYAFDAHVLPQLGRVEVADLTASRLRRWLADMAAKPARRRTGAGDAQRFKPEPADEEAVRRRRSAANRVLGVVRACLNHAFREGNAPSDAAWKRVEKFGDVEAARLRYLSLDEATRLANACNPDFRPLLQAGLLTGARYGELCRLEVRDFDLNAGAIHVRKSKSHKSRFVSLNDEAVALFAQICAGRAAGERMFLMSSGRPWGKSDQRRPMEEACERARVERITFHGLRHSFISHAVMRGVPLAVVAETVGHRDLRMLSKFYAHLAPSHVRDAIKANAPRFGFDLGSNVASLRSRRNP
jgi:integrase